MKIARIMFLLSLIIMLGSLGCQSTQQMKQFSVNEDGYLAFGQGAMHKDAVRLRGMILSKGKKLGDRIIYEMEVDEVVQLGATVSSIVPRQGEKVELVTLSTIKLKRNLKIMIDAYTPQRRGDGLLSIDMINN